MPTVLTMRPARHFIPALALLVLVYWLVLWAQMGKTLRQSGTPCRVNIGGGVAGEAGGNGTNCITTVAAPAQPITTAGAPAEITGAAAAAAKPEKTEAAEEKAVANNVGCCSLVRQELELELPHHSQRPRALQDDAEPRYSGVSRSSCQVSFFGDFVRPAWIKKGDITGDAETHLRCLATTKNTAKLYKEVVNFLVHKVLLAFISGCHCKKFFEVPSGFNWIVYLLSLPEEEKRKRKKKKKKKDEEKDNRKNKKKPTETHEPAAVARLPPPPPPPTPIQEHTSPNGLSREDNSYMLPMNRPRNVLRYM
ncbi:hypothetical protein B0T20DRAFT_485290 [Sordaria brevicollis]|uniref:Uncharacterized protein n=1 Tax=Sordaria brevicollis TaxID=83679 RepID=A0AAE0PN30_SORBR|nr:hypothetical protein B0T20DRAFT_485290 [Sordaria brevicollis]